MVPARRLPEQAALFDRAEVRPVIPGPDLTSYDIILTNLSGGEMGGPGPAAPATLDLQARRLGITPAGAVCAFLPSLYLTRLDEALRGADVTARDMYEGTRGIGEQRHVNAEVARQPCSCFQGMPPHGPAGGAGARSAPAPSSAPAAGAQ